MDTTTASDEIILLGEVGALSDGSVSTDHHHHHHLTHDGQEMHVLVPSGTTSHETLIHLSSMSGLSELPRSSQLRLLIPQLDYN